MSSKSLQTALFTNVDKLEPIDQSVAVQWAPLNSASKYAGEFGPIKWAELKRPAWKYVEELGPIKQDAQLSRARIKRAHCNLQSTT